MPLHSENCFTVLHSLTAWIFYNINSISLLSNTMPSRPSFLTSKISNPAMSNTPMKCCLDCFVSNCWLIRITIHRNIFSKTDLAKAPTLLYTCIEQKGLYQHTIGPVIHCLWILFLANPYLLNSLTFGDKFIANFDSGIAQSFQQICWVEVHEIGSLIRNWAQK